MNFLIKKITIIFIFAIISSCCCKKNLEKVNASAKETKKDYAQDGFQKATVINYEVDGCHFLLQLESEEKLDPSNLAEEFKKDHLQVWVKYNVQKGAMGTCMAGKKIIINVIELRQ